MRAAGRRRGRKWGTPLCGRSGTSVELLFLENFLIFRHNCNNITVRCRIEYLPSALNGLDDTACYIGVRLQKPEAADRLIKEADQ